MLKNVIACMLLLLCSGTSFAQLNESDTVRFQLRASLTGAYQQGNVEVLNIRSKLDFSFSRHHYWVFKSQNSSLYQEFYSLKADNDIFSRNYLYYKPSHTIYPFAIAYVSTNFRRKIQYRYFAGAGTTYQLIDNQKNVLKLSASAVYESTHFMAFSFNYPEYNGNETIHLCRATFYIAGWNYFLDRHIRLYYDAYWQPAFNNRHNYRTQLDIGADLTIWKGLSCTILYGYSHENVVVTNIRQKDKLLTFGLAYNLRRI